MARARRCSSTPRRATSSSIRPPSACPTSRATSSSPGARWSRRGRLVNQRVAPCPLEVRGVGGGVGRRPAAPVDLDPARPRRQGAVRRGQRRRPDDDVRVITPDVGGGFGAKITPLPRGDAARPDRQAVGRPVRWQETRSESMVALGHGRAQVQHVTIGGRRDGTVTHYRLSVIQDSGAFCDMAAILAPFMTRPMASGVYDIPNIECRTTLGRHEHDTDRRLPRRRASRGDRRDRAGDGPVRRRDRHRSGRASGARTSSRRSPSRTPPSIGQTYDCGDYAGALDRVLEAAGYDGRCAPSRRDAASPAMRCQLGIGVSTYVEITGACRRSARTPASRSPTTVERSSTPGPRPTDRATRQRGR